MNMLIRSRRTQLWMSEGITDYYADLAEVRGGVIDASGFYAATSEKIKEVMNAPPTALEDASLSAWVHPVDGTEYLYYPKGSLAGLALDIQIRDASDNRQSLDDVMRALYQSAYKQGRGFTSSDWWAAVSAAADGKSFASFYARFIDGREPFPWDSILPLAGLRARRDRVPRLGVVTQMDGGRDHRRECSGRELRGARRGARRRRPAVRGRHRRGGPAVWRQDARQVWRVGRGVTASDQGAARRGDAHAGRQAAIRGGRRRRRSRPAPRRRRCGFATGS